MLGALTGYCLQVPFPHDQVSAPTHFDFELVVRVEQHPVTDLDSTDVMTDAVHLTPAQPLGYLRGRWDQDSPTTASLAVFTHKAHDHTVVEHLNFELAFGHGKRVRAALKGARYGPYLGAPL